MNQKIELPTETEWICANCQIPLEPAQVNVSYLNNAFPVEMLCCPKCGFALVPEELAMGRMAKVEKVLEDK